jgi:hypothetical protein
MMVNSHLNKGAAMILFVLFFAFASGAIMLALAQNIFSDVSDLNQITQAKQTFLVAESLTEDVVYRRIFETMSLDMIEQLTLNGITAYSTTTFDSPSDTYTIDSSAQRRQTLRKSQAVMISAAGSAFNYGMQAGNGGITMANSASIIGNVYANGSVIGGGSSEVTGDVVSAGPTGLAQDVDVTGSIFANKIENIEAGGDAHYNVQVGSNGQNPVAGTRYTPVTNQATSSFPLSTTTIQEWKDAVDTYGTVIAATDPECSSGTYTIDVSMSIGYLKVECDVDIQKNGTFVTLTGPIWVQGNLTFTQGPVMRVDPSLGRKSVQIIVDNPADRITSSQIKVLNSATFYGSGDSRSYIMLLSENESASLGGAEFAIEVSQSISGSVITYTNKGLVDIGNGIDLRSVTGYQINIAQNSDVIYETGLASLLFSSGPGGGYTLDDWQQSE